MVMQSVHKDTKEDLTKLAALKRMHLQEKAGVFAMHRATRARANKQSA